jgi:hypothetical protein
LFIIALIVWRDRSMSSAEKKVDLKFNIYAKLNEHEADNVVSNILALDNLILSRMCQTLQNFPPRQQHSTQNMNGNENVFSRLFFEG